MTPRLRRTRIGRSGPTAHRPPPPRHGSGRPTCASRRTPSSLLAILRGTSYTHGAPLDDHAFRLGAHDSYCAVFEVRGGDPEDAHRAHRMQVERQLDVAPGGRPARTRRRLGPPRRPASPRRSAAHPLPVRPSSGSGTKQGHQCDADALGAPLFLLESGFLVDLQSRRSSSAERALTSIDRIDDEDHHAETAAGHHHRPLCQTACDAGGRGEPHRSRGCEALDRCSVLSVDDGPPAPRNPTPVMMPWMTRDCGVWRSRHRQAP